jgi:hypothetical protein
MAGVIFRAQICIFRCPRCVTTFFLNLFLIPVQHQNYPYNLGGLGSPCSMVLNISMHLYGFFMMTASTGQMAEQHPQNMH